MKAAVLYELNQPLRVVEVDVPNVKMGQVEVDLVYSGVCHSQLMEVSGGRGEDKYLPHLLGHEGVGVVKSIGENVTKVNIGDKVVLGWIKGQGHDVPGGLYQCNGQTINAGSVTTFNQTAIVSENRLVKLPEGMPMKLGVLLGCALPTGAGLVFNELKPEVEKTIVVFGLGGVGLSALIAANYYQPSMLVAVDVSPEKLELAKQLGATHVINSSETDPVECITRLTGHGADYSIEASGQAFTIEQAFESIRDGGGKCIFASHPKDGDKISLEPHAFHRGKSIQGSWGGGSNPDTDIPKLVNLYKKGHLNLEPFLSKGYALDDINSAMDDLRKGAIVRALIEINPELDI
ncbi:zinc-binding dehydrogenase [Paraglaciecola sp.]|uniref:zinc-binding dehydrogenase n=1 Tax=Paraglaciecola sp. TaxID=1920173 RepID=UPI003EF9B238